MRRVLHERLLCIIIQQPAAMVSAAYLRPLKPAAHWHCPVTWSHSPPLRQEQSLLQLMPYLPRGHGWAQTEPFEKQPAKNHMRHIVHDFRRINSVSTFVDMLFMFSCLFLALYPPMYKIQFYIKEIT